MQSVTFQPTADDLLAANRVYFHSLLKGRRLLRPLLIGSAAVGAIGAAVFWALGGRPVLGFGIGALYWVVLLAAILGTNYLLLPRRSRRTFAQQKALHQETEVAWEEDGITFRSAQGTTRFGWSDFVRIYEGSGAIIFFQSDALYNFVPTRALTDEQMADIRARAQAPF